MPDLQDEAERRFTAIHTGMEKNALDALIVYSTPWKVEYVHYVANYRPFGADACLVLPLSGEPSLFISEPWDLGRAVEESWVPGVQAVPRKMLAEAGRTARKHGMRIGVFGVEQLTGEKHEELLGGLGGAGFSNEWDLLNRLAMVKTSREVEILRKCAALADYGFRAEINAIRPGISEYELAAEIEYAMRSRGADDNFQMIAVGRDLQAMTVSGERRVSPGDLVLSEITPLMGCISYATQLCRTVKLGPASPLEKEKYDLLVAALEASLELIRPGARAEDIARKQNEVIGAAGYERFCRPPYMRSRGHNFGLGHIELEEGNGLELLPNMVMVVHPNQFIPETGYLACGETILVTESGFERLNQSPAKLYEA